MSIELSKALLTTEAEEVAKKAVGESSNMKTTASQMRKYYDDFVIIQNKCKGQKEESDFTKSILPLIAFSKAKLAYSAGRKSIPKEFMTMINRKVDQIATRKDFDNFLLFYQAVIGYAKYYEKFPGENDLAVRNDLAGRKPYQNNNQNYKYGFKK